MTKPPPRANIYWNPAFRLIATRFPAVDLWAGMPTELWDRIDQVESLTNARLNVGRPQAASYIQWPFANPRPGRFSTDTLGAFYAAREESAAVAETVHYQAIRCREDNLDPHDFDMRVLQVEVEGRFHDLRGKRADAYPGAMDADHLGVSQALAMDLYALGSPGIVYSSVRDVAHTACVAAFDPGTLKACSHLRFLTYRWDGDRVWPIYEKKPLGA